MIIGYCDTVGAKWHSKRLLLKYEHLSVLLGQYLRVKVPTISSLSQDMISTVTSNRINPTLKTNFDTQNCKTYKWGCRCSQRLARNDLGRGISAAEEREQPEGGSVGNKVVNLLNSSQTFLTWLKLTKDFLRHVIQALLVTVTPVRVTIRLQWQFFGHKKDLLLLKIMG